MTVCGRRELEPLGQNHRRRIAATVWTAIATTRHIEQTICSGWPINEADQPYFVGDASAFKQMERVETSLCGNARVVITEHGIRPPMLAG